MAKFNSALVSFGMSFLVHTQLSFSSYQTQDQENSEEQRDALYWLKEATKNALETDELADTALEMLDLQNEQTLGIRDNLNRLDKAAERGGDLITRIEHPWSGKSRVAAEKNKKRLKAKVFRDENVAEGSVKVRFGFWRLKWWWKRELKLEDACVYTGSQKKGESQKMISLDGATVEQIKTEKYNKRFAICVTNKKKKIVFRLDSRKERDNWIEMLKDEIANIELRKNPEYKEEVLSREQKVRKDQIVERSVVKETQSEKAIYFIGKEEDAQLDILDDILDDLKGKVRLIGEVTEESTDMINDLTQEVEYQDQRIVGYTERVKDEIHR